MYVRVALDSDDCFRSTRMELGLRPMPGNFRSFALVGRGVVFGFWSGQIADPGCGAFAISVPFDLIRPYLSETGRNSIALLRQPR
jgi:hypothetical protein